jgi:methyltransferase (TIGR00027 family)
MRAGVPSRTAQRVALRRAAHQVLDHPHVFDDPLAFAIVGQKAAAELEMQTGTIDRRLRAFIAVRSRYAEDQLARAIANGVRQYVVLGAGLDTYAYRSHPDVRVFEVDHPATQEWKRWRLDQGGIAIPDSTTFVPVDFLEQRLDEELARAGFNLTDAAFFSWLGVIMYLTLEAATITLRFIASRPRGSGVAFDYALSASALGPLMRIARNMLARRVARAGEPFQLYFDPAGLSRLLRELGFAELEDLSPQHIDERYFANRADGLKIGSGAAHLMCAWV